MRISVITGPVLSDQDPTKDGVRIPIEFWKVIVFVHDLTAKLTATGYLMSQESFLSNEEFVFGAHGTSQRSLKSLEIMTGLKFEGLVELDPLSSGEESTQDTLTSFEQIRFV
jgi:endonuclease G, mitochondrial